MYWVHKGCKPNIDKFEIINFQIAEDILHQNIFIKDKGNFYQYYHL